MTPTSELSRRLDMKLAKSGDFEGMVGTSHQTALLATRPYQPSKSET
jgi:hypothetical protein